MTVKELYARSMALLETSETEASPKATVLSISGTTTCTIPTDNARQRRPMADKELVKMVAGKLGWNQLIWHGKQWFGVPPRDEIFRGRVQYRYVADIGYEVPDWLNSLDAAYAVVMGLMVGQQEAWACALERIVWNATSIHVQNMMYQNYTATAKQWIEAYLEVKDDG